MKPEIFSLGQKLQRVFVATADSTGLPHIGITGEIAQDSAKKLTVSAWFCPGTLKNLEQNRLVSLVIWDSEKDDGYQLLGKVESMEEQAIMNGHASELEARKPVPQVKWMLVVNVDKVINFTGAPHSDVEE